MPIAIAFVAAAVMVILYRVAGMSADAVITGGAMAAVSILVILRCWQRR